MASSDKNLNSPDPNSPNPRPTNPSGPADRSDRARLEQIQRTDVTESKINEEFIDWLKTKGMNYAAILLLVLVGIMVWNTFKDRRAQERDAAWVDLAGASLPGSLEDVAQRHRGTDSIAPWALLDAAERYYSAVQRGVRFFDREPGDEDYELTPELRAQWLEESDRIFGEVAEQARTSRDHERRAFLVAALWGRAAIAESRGEADAARGFLSEIEEVTRTSHPAVAELAEARLANLDSVVAAGPLPSRGELPQPEAGQPLVEPIVTDDLLRELLQSSSPGDSGAPPPPPPAGAAGEE